MQIQIFGTNKNFDCKKAQIWFKERRINFQFVDLKEKQMSKGEFDSVVQVLTKTEGNRQDAILSMIDKSSKDYSNICSIRLHRVSGYPPAPDNLPSYPASF